MKEAESIIDELLKWTEETEKPNLSQMEEVVLKLRERLSQKMVESIIEGQEAKGPVPGPSCPECGAEMRYKGEKGKRVSSWVGQIELERSYYYCARCRVGDFPPGPTT